MKYSNKGKTKRVKKLWTKEAKQMRINTLPKVQLNSINIVIILVLFSPFESAYILLCSKTARQ